ncbi:MAG: UDP-N-acetylmuramate--L-alanine ligase [Proteobacteria bacterium]|nr:MAG: UDP-N-acetylmuramate--L-alanine ligase [Pseudomonadota bacterium]
MKKVHFIGIGGIGLSAICRFLKKQGYQITGSDIKRTPIIKELENEGIRVNVPHHKDNIKDQDLIIYSAAIKEDNEELQEAKKQGKTILSRKEALPLVLRDKKVFSVAGAHGKSTTSAMLASIIDGSVIIGAISKQFGSNMFYKESENIIFEADESDASFLNSNPHVAVVTNAEPEHMEFYNYDYDKFYGGYKEFLNKATFRVINAEDEFLSSLHDLDATRLYPSRDIKDIKTIIKDNEPFTSFKLKDLGVFEVWGVGEHMAIDASLAIMASSHQHDIPTIKERLKKFRGIKKRFDILSSSEDFALIDDYAHHPTEIKATLKSARSYGNAKGLESLNVIWQPHKFSRTIDNLDGFKECFEGVDNLVILPVFAAGESEQKIDFKKEFAAYNPKFTKKIQREKDGISFLNGGNKKILNKGLIIGFGAGDITYQLRGI